MAEGFKLINLSKIAPLELDGFDPPFGLNGAGQLTYEGGVVSKLKLGNLLFNIATGSRYTWYFRIRQDASPSQQTALFQVNYSVGGLFFISTNQSTSGDIAITYTGGTTRTTTTISTGAFHDVFITLSAGIWKVFMDGTEAVYATNPNLSTSMTGTTFADSGNLCCQLRGVAQFESFYFWENRVLSSTEISVYDRTVNNLNPTQAYEFNEDAANTGFTYPASASGHLIQDAIRIETPEEPEFSSERSSRGDLQSILHGSKSNITLELDVMSRLDYTKLRRDLHDRIEPHKLFLDFPAQESQIINFSATGSEIFHEANANADLDLNTGTATEFTIAQYNDIANPLATDISLSTLLQFQYLFFRMDINSFTTNRPNDPIKRITLAYKNLHLLDSNGDNGIFIHAFDTVRGVWVEVKRQSITVDQSYTQFASIRPVDGFENMENFAKDGLVFFRMRNLVTNPDLTQNITMKIRHAKGFVNGYGVVFTGADNATYRDTFIEQGYVQTLDFKEL